MTELDEDQASAPAPRLLRLAVLVVFGGLVFGVAHLPPAGRGLTDAVEAQMAATGVANRVTATLLNFRAYDTLLEMTVLLVAVVAVLAIRRGAPPKHEPPGEVLAALAHVQVPLMILVAAYLLWSGSDVPGGAFQAGAMLGAAGILFVLAGGDVPRSLDGRAARVGLILGVGLFIVFGVTGLLRGVALLTYPAQGAGAVILALEAGATLSVAIALFEMFRSVLRGGSVRAAGAEAGGNGR